MPQGTDVALWVRRPKDDPALSPEGQQRTKLLAETLASANVQAIVTTHYRRTQETAAPLAKRLGLLPTVLPIRPGPQSAHIAEVIAAVRKLIDRPGLTGCSPEHPASGPVSRGTPFRRLFIGPVGNTLLRSVEGLKLHAI